MHDIVSRLGAWSQDRSSYIMLGTANSLATADAVTSGNYNIAAFVATATVAATGLVGVTKYVIENLGPVYTKYRVDRNNALSSTVVGQLQSLQQQNEANAVLAKTYQDSLQEERRRREDDSVDRAKRMDELNHSLAIAREQLTNLTQASQAALLKAEIADKNEKAAQEDRKMMAAQLEAVKVQLELAQGDRKIVALQLEAVKAQLNEAKDQLQKSSVPISQTNETVHEIAENVQALVSDPLKETTKGDHP